MFGFYKILSNALQDDHGWQGSCITLYHVGKTLYKS